MLREKIARLQASFAMMCTKSTLAASELKEDENAMEVIQVVMLIAVGVLAISAVWAGVNGLLEEWWAILTGANKPGGPTLS